MTLNVQKSYGGRVFVSTLTGTLAAQKSYGGRVAIWSPVASGAGITASLAATETGPDIFTSGAFIGYKVAASLAATETGPDILASDVFIGYKVSASFAATEVGPDIFAASAYIGAPPSPPATDIYLVKLRSFTEHRRF
jgi:hypothetical protein